MASARSNYHLVSNSHAFMMERAILPADEIIVGRVHFVKPTTPVISNWISPVDN